MLVLNGKNVCNNCSDNIQERIHSSNGKINKKLLMKQPPHITSTHNLWAPPEEAVKTTSKASSPLWAPPEDVVNAVSKASSPASTPKSVRIAPYAKVSMVAESPQICFDPVKCEFAPDEGTQHRIYEVRSGDGKSAPTITRDRGWPNGEMWRLIWSFHGLLMLALLGVGLLFIVFLSPTQRLKLFGEENYFVVQVAASYMFSLQYLCVVGVCALFCGVSGLASLVPTSNQIQTQIQVTTCVLLALLLIYSTLSCVVELVIGIVNLPLGMYDTYLAKFQKLAVLGHPDLPYSLALPSKTDGGLEEPRLDDLRLDDPSLDEIHLENIGSETHPETYARAVKAKCLHFWLCLGFSVVAILLLCIGDAYSKIVFGVGKRKIVLRKAIGRKSYGEADEEVGTSMTLSASSMGASASTSASRTSMPSRSTESTTAGSAHYKFKEGLVVSKF